MVISSVCKVLPNRKLTGNTDAGTRNQSNRFSRIQGPVVKGPGHDIPANDHAPGRRGKLESGGFVLKGDTTKDKSYLFDVGTAVKYGLDAAVIIRNFQFWVERNYANGKHRHDGRTWTYCSIAAMTELFPFFTTRQIRTILDKLLSRGVLVKGRYNPKGHDRTTWYAFEDEKTFVRIDKCICQKRQVHLSELTNASAGIDKPISDIKHISNTDIKDIKGISSPVSISSKNKRDEAADHDKLDALQRLVFHGVNPEVADRFIFDHNIPPESVFNVCKNGLVREQNSRKTGGSWRMHPGYIVAAIKKARSEGKIIQPTKASKLRDKIEESKKATPLSQDEFEKRRTEQTEKLSQAI